MCIAVWSYLHYLKKRPVKYRHGLPMLLGEFEQLTLLRLILEHSGIYLHELQEKLLQMFGVTVSVCRPSVEFEHSSSWDVV